MNLYAIFLKCKTLILGGALYFLRITVCIENFSKIQSVWYDK